MGKGTSIVWPNAAMKMVWPHARIFLFSNTAIYVDNRGEPLKVILLKERLREKDLMTSLISSVEFP